MFFTIKVFYLLVLTPPFRLAVGSRTASVMVGLRGACCVFCCAVILVRVHYEFLFTFNETDAPLIQIIASKQVASHLSLIISTLPKLCMRQDHCESVRISLVCWEMRKAKLLGSL